MINFVFYLCIVYLIFEYQFIKKMVIYKLVKNQFYWFLLVIYKLPILKLVNQFLLHLGYYLFPILTNFNQIGSS